MKTYVMLIAILGMMVMTVPAQDTENVENSEKAENSRAPIKKIDVSGFSYFMFGQIVSGFIGDVNNKEGQINHLWQNFGETDLIAVSRRNSWFIAKAGVRLQTSYPAGFNSMEKSSYYMKFIPSIPTAEGILHWDFSKLSLGIESGLFQYNSNPEIKTFGNYLYRSSAYPLFLGGAVDYPWADLMGLRAEVSFLDNKLKIEGIIDSKYDHPPWYDWNVGLTATYKPNALVTVGGGICFDHLLSVNNYETMARYLAFFRDSASGDTTYYSYKSTKLDARVAFDPKPLFGDVSFLGPEDCKVYAEAGIIGLKDYKYYTGDLEPNLWHRTAIALGVNLPGFKIVDVISLEGEFFNSPYANAWAGQASTGYDPRPVQTFDTALINNYRNLDNFKWSVYLSKKLGDFEMKFIAANDHSIYKTFNIENLPCFEQSLRRSNNWHWYLKLQYNL